MSDRPIKSNDASSERSGFQNAGLAVAAAEPGLNVIQHEWQRQANDFRTLSDEFGNKLFPTSHALLTENHEQAGIMKSAGPAALGLDNEFRVNRIQQAGERKGSADLGALAALDQAANAKSLPELLRACDAIDKAASVGDQRTDRLTYVLQNRNGEYDREIAIKMEIAGVREEKLMGLSALEEQQPRGDKSKPSSANKPNDFVVDFYTALNKEIHHRGDDISKNFADWADVRILAGKLGDKQTAENSMTELISKARDGSPAARDILAATLVSGSASDSWLIAKRGDYDGVQRSVTVPKLPEALGTAIKCQAAKALISLAELKPLSRSEHMALAIAMGQAFANRMNGDNSAANDDLVKTTVKHFIKTLSTKPDDGKTPEEKDKLSNRLINGMSGLFDAVACRAPGAGCLQEFLNQMVGADSSTVRISPLVSATRETQMPNPRLTEADSAASSFATLLSAFSSTHSPFRQFLEPELKRGEKRKAKPGMTGDKPADAGKPAGRPAAGKGRQTDVRRLTHQENERTSFKVGERKEFLELDSGRFYDPVLRRFFKRDGERIVEDSTSPTDRERCEIAQRTKTQDEAIFVREPVAAGKQTSAVSK